MFDWEDERELSDDERREQDLVAELRAEQQERDDEMGLLDLPPSQRAEARVFHRAFARVVAMGPPAIRPVGGTSGFEAEHPGPERPPAGGTSGWEAEQDMPDRPAETRERQEKGEKR